MSESPFLLTFPGASTADANRYAADLSAALHDVDRNLNIERRRDRPDAQDYGATLALVLGSASVSAVAGGVAAWLARHSGATIQIDADGNVLAKNLDSRDASRIAEALSRRK